MANFLLLLHQTPGRFRNLSPEEIQKILGSYIAWREALVKRNKMRAGEKLTDDGGRTWHQLAFSRGGAAGRSMTNLAPPFACGSSSSVPP